MASCTAALFCRLGEFGRLRPDQAFEQRADHGRRRDRHILLGHMLVRDGDADAAGELGGDGLAEFEPRFVGLLVDRLGQHRPGEPPLAQQPRGERRERGGKRRQRPGRGVGGAADRRELALGDDADQFGDEIGLGREIAIDGAGGDAGALGDAARSAPRACRPAAAASRAASTIDCSRSASRRATLSVRR